MENVTSVAIASIFASAMCMAVGSFASAFAEGMLSKQAMQSIAQQPDESSEISKTLFISMSLIESSAIYCLLVSMILIFSNPFWDFVLTKI